MNTFGIYDTGVGLFGQDLMWQCPLFDCRQISAPFFSFSPVTPNFDIPPFQGSKTILQVLDTSKQEILFEGKAFPQEAEYHRKQKSLEELSNRVLNSFGQRENVQFELETLITDLCIERRRVYDIINIYQSLGIVKRLGRKNYQWNGLSHFVEKMHFLDVEKENAIKHPCALRRPFEELTLEFILLLSGRPNSTRLENAAEQLGKNSEESSRKTLKTKVRRLYDIANVLMSLGVVQRVRLNNNRQQFCWVGIGGFRRTFGDIEPHSARQTEKASSSFFWELLMTNGISGSSAQNEVEDFIEKWQSLWRQATFRKCQPSELNSSSPAGFNRFTFPQNLKDVSNITPLRESPSDLGPRGQIAKTLNDLI